MTKSKARQEQSDYEILLLHDVIPIHTSTKFLVSYEVIKLKYKMFVFEGVGASI